MVSEEREPNAKDFALQKANEIISITMDLKYARNMFLIHKGFEEIERLSNRIIEHLEYLDVCEREEE